MWLIVNKKSAYRWRTMVNQFVGAIIGNGLVQNPGRFARAAAHAQELLDSSLLMFMWLITNSGYKKTI